MFDLNEAIAGWRTKLAAGGACGKSDLDELEAHLREEIENLTPSGLAEEEAFLVAKHRLGQPASLAREFAKVNRGAVWGFRVFWIVAGTLLFFVLPQFAVAISRGLPFIVPLSGLGVYGTIGSSLVLAGTFFLLYRAARRHASAAGVAPMTGGRKGLAILLGGLAIAALSFFSVRIAAQAQMLWRSPLVGSAIRLLFFWYGGWFLSIALPAVWAVLVIRMHPAEPRQIEE